MQTDDSLITGVVVYGAQSPTAAPVEIRIVGDRNRVTASHVGTDATGTRQVSGIGYGISIVGNDNVIGGTPTERNVIVQGYGVYVVAGQGNTITGNRIGTNAGGTKPFSGAAGVRIGESDGTDADGTVGTVAVLPGWLPASSVVTATATPLTAAGTPTSTSEFSECMVVP